MPQLSIGERIKFLLDAQGGSIRKFARMLDVSDTNIRNYIEKGTKPSSDTLEAILQNIPHINPAWLLTGEGEAFLMTAEQISRIGLPEVKNNSGNAIGVNHGKATQQQGGQPGGASRISAETALQVELNAYKQENEFLKAQVAEKERTIQILLKQQS